VVLRFIRVVDFGLYGKWTTKGNVAPETKSKIIVLLSAPLEGLAGCGGERNANDERIQPGVCLDAVLWISTKEP
jgi:hypothetical protein